MSRQCLKQFEGVHPFAEYYARVVVDWQMQWESREGSARLVGVRHKLYLLRRLSKVSTDQMINSHFGSLEGSEKFVEDWQLCKYYSCLVCSLGLGRFY